MSTDQPAAATATNESWTVRRVLEWTIAHLKKSGSETPRLDAEILLAHARGCQRIQLYVQYDVELEPEQRLQMRDLVKRRAAHEPVAYLVGHREFFSLDFEVQRGVLIPRPDTETLVVQLLELAKTFESPRVLELCTGSACIAVATAKNLAKANVTTVEIDPAVCEVARRNIAKHGVGERVELVQGDLFGPIGQRQFEIIASNPPYISDADMLTLEPTVRLHEPELALRAGADGLDIIRRIVAEAATHLVAGGAVLLEISPEQAASVIELFAAAGSFEPARIAKDLAGRSRVVWTRKIVESGESRDES